MTDERVARLLVRFAVAARSHSAALDAMNGEMAERQAAVIGRLFAAIVLDGEKGRNALLLMAEGDDPVVAGMAAIYSLRYSSGRALAVLTRLAGEPGLLGFRARIAMERWESGEWELDSE